MFLFFSLFLSLSSRFESDDSDVLLSLIKQQKYCEQIINDEEKRKKKNVYIKDKKEVHANEKKKEQRCLDENEAVNFFFY